MLRGVRVESKVSGLSRWKMELPFTERGRAVCSTLWGMTGTSVLDIRHLRQLLDIQVQMLSWLLVIQAWGLGETLGVDLNLAVVSN